MPASQEPNSLLQNGSVCFLNYDLAFGGTEKVIAALANHLSSSGRAVTILTLSNRNDFKSFIDPSIQIVSLNVSRIKFFIPTLIRFISTHQFDNFLANVWPLTSLSFVLRIFSRKTRLIYIEHCNLSEQFKNKSLFFKAAQNISIYVFYKFAHLIVSVSKGVRDDLIIKGVNPKKIKVIYNPVISRPMLPIGKSVKGIQHWMSSSKKKLIAVGELKSQKNFINLVDAIFFVKKNLNLDINLLILGDGVEKESIQNKINNLGLAENIYLAGWVDDPLPYFDLADLFVLSSNYEGFGVVIVEAMSQGLNIVSTNCNSGPSEILEDGRLGVLCSVNDYESLGKAIDHALKNPIDQRILIERSEEFSETKIGSLYEEILI
jgi:glycosyltransferase involved in cell wall biosynthesis